MRCNYLPIWFICSCRERPSIHFTLEEPNSHFDLKCNFQQSWSQQFGLNTAQACAGRTKEGWEGESRERWVRAQEAALPQHPHPGAGNNLVFLPAVSKTRWAASPATISVQHLTCSDPSTHDTSSESSSGLHKHQPSLPKRLRERSQVRARKTEEFRSRGITFSEIKTSCLIFTSSFCTTTTEPILLCMQRPAKKHQIMA